MLEYMIMAATVLFISYSFELTTGQTLVALGLGFLIASIFGLYGGYNEIL